jgi:hypothetical protein
MQCLEFESRLQSVLDARQAPQADAALGGHAAECAECRQLLAAMTAVAEYAAAMPAVCPAGLTRQVLQQMQPRRRVLPLRWAAGLAAAAALAGVLPLWSWLSGGHGPTAQTAETHHEVQLAQTVPNRPAPQPPSPKSPIVEPTTAEPWSLVPELSAFSAQNSHELSAGFNGFGDDVREGLAPVTRSTAGALESLWQALSPTEDNRS